MIRINISYLVIIQQVHLLIEVSQNLEEKALLLNEKYLRKNPD
jgi:hypothetical protein